MCADRTPIAKIKNGPHVIDVRLIICQRNESLRVPAHAGLLQKLTAHVAQPDAPGFNYYHHVINSSREWCHTCVCVCVTSISTWRMIL